MNICSTLRWTSHNNWYFRFAFFSKSWIHFYNIWI
ncbi:unnamed protein product [Schistosoma curassoni]|uniref:Uncharacterized protein n=1 Tax=Schistosoma curassoni TaxID=6186 RepID=A0A183KBA3_9TREM|nr:unnamed protein product [Schistosoma curassoni]